MTQNFYYESINELFNDWPVENDGEDSKKVEITLKHHESKIKNKPKTIVCHDYRFNYQEQSAMDQVQSHSLSINDNAKYLIQFHTFIHWSLIDIFVYFSHKFITIPAVPWIDACHRNGVQCFGTIIVEEWSSYDDFGENHSDQRINGKKLLEKLLGNIEILDQFITTLVNVQKYFKFDGWFINIETSLSSNHLIKHLNYFLQQLKLEMNSRICWNNELEDYEIPSIQLIWYDSLTIDGKLDWQNELNTLNESFFLDSDAIFLNYNWNDDKLLRSKRLAAKYQRQYDCFVGIDCYGRGCNGCQNGSIVNTSNAVKKILDHDLSVAIFAPGWTHESKINEIDIIDQHSDDHSFDCQTPFWKMTDDQCYSVNDEIEFWSTIANDSNLRKYSKKLLKHLPIHTCFNIGHGYGSYRQGKCIDDHLWLDFNRIDLQPQLLNCHNQSGYKLSFINDQSYNGGTSLRIDFNTGQIKPLTLFRTKIEISKNLKYKYRLVYKSIVPANVKLRTIISYYSANGAKNSIKIDANDPNHQVHTFENQFNEISEAKNEFDWTVQEIQLDFNTHKIGTDPDQMITLSKFQIEPSVNNLSNVVESIISMLLGEFYFAKL